MTLVGEPGLKRSIFGICAATALLAGCGARTPSEPSAIPQTSAFVPDRAITRRIDRGNPFHVVHEFAGGLDGANPQAGLVDVNGTLYGTTASGGSSNRGTVYAIDPAGRERVLYSFTGPPDGAFPVTGLIAVHGTLYGTTEYGGYKCMFYPGCGTVFSISTAGVEKVLHRFLYDGARAGLHDGMNPEAGLIDVRGTLYGTTYQGGAGYGTVFSITPNGDEKVLYRFAGPIPGHADGANPQAGLLDVNGTLYGTTENGGPRGIGTVYSISTTGMETPLHYFAGGADGANPQAGLIDVNGILYGTTSDGGGSRCPRVEFCGTVYRITTSGIEKVLHSFGHLSDQASTDGAYPLAGLVAVDGTLYGTTEEGNVGGCGYYAGCGTVFSISPTGNERVLHSFAGYKAMYPWASVIDVNGTLYGTTWQGGKGNCEMGCGTVFAFSR